MSLKQILDKNKSHDKKKEVSEERLEAILPRLRETISFYRMYPDVFIDHIKGPEQKFKFYTYQRVFLRQQMRYKNTYGVYPRAYSKSFLTMMALMLKAVLYPRSNLFVSTGGKI